MHISTLLNPLISILMTKNTSTVKWLQETENLERLIIVHTTIVLDILRLDGHNLTHFEQLVIWALQNHHGLCGHGYSQNTFINSMERKCFLSLIPSAISNHTLSHWLLCQLYFPFSFGKCRVEILDFGRERDFKN